MEHRPSECKAIPNATENTARCRSLQHHNVHTAARRFHKILQALILLNLSPCLRNRSADILIFIFIIPFSVLAASSSSGGFGGAMGLVQVSLPLPRSGGFAAGGSTTGRLKSAAGHHPDFWTKSTGCSELLTTVPWVPAQVRPRATGSCSHKQYDCH